MIAVSRPPKIVLYKFSPNIRCCLFITSLSPRVHVPESHVPESHVPESYVLEFHVSESHVSESHVSESHVPESHVRKSTSASLRPRVHVRESTSASPRPRVHVHEFQSLSPTSSILTLSPHVPVSFLVTASIFVAVWSFGGAVRRSFPDIWFSIFLLANELLNRKSLPLVKKQPLPISRGVQHYLHFSVFF